MEPNAAGAPETGLGRPRARAGTGVPGWGRMPAHGPENAKPPGMGTGRWVRRAEPVSGLKKGTKGARGRRLGPRPRGSQPVHPSNDSRADGCKSPSDRRQLAATSVASPRLPLSPIAPPTRLDARTGGREGLTRRKEFAEAPVRKPKLPTLDPGEACHSLTPMLLGGGNGAVSRPTRFKVQGLQGRPAWTGAGSRPRFGAPPRRTGFPHTSPCTP